MLEGWFRWVLEAAVRGRATTEKRKAGNLLAVLVVFFGYVYVRMSLPVAVNEIMAGSLLAMNPKVLMFVFGLVWIVWHAFAHHGLCACFRIRTVKELYNGAWMSWMWLRPVLFWAMFAARSECWTLGCWSYSVVAVESTETAHAFQPEGISHLAVHNEVCETLQFLFNLDTNVRRLFEYDVSQVWFGVAAFWHAAKLLRCSAYYVHSFDESERQYEFSSCDRMDAPFQSYMVLVHIACTSCVDVLVLPALYRVVNFDRLAYHCHHQHYCHRSLMIVIIDFVTVVVVAIIHHRNSSNCHVAASDHYSLPLMLLLLHASSAHRCNCRCYRCCCCFHYFLPLLLLVLPASSAHRCNCSCYRCCFCLLSTAVVPADACFISSPLHCSCCLCCFCLLCSTACFATRYSRCCCHYARNGLC